jgi:hypothetical protein
MQSNNKKPLSIVSTHDYDQVDNAMVERRPAATKVSTGERRRYINKEYCCPYTQLMRFHAAVQKIYRNREHYIPITYLFMPPPTVAT